MAKHYCNICYSIIRDNELVEPYGLSGCEPACPNCGGSDFSDAENGDNGTSLTEEEYDRQMRGEIQRHGGG